MYQLAPNAYPLADALIAADAAAGRARAALLAAYESRAHAMARMAEDCAARAARHGERAAGSLGEGGMHLDLARQQARNARLCAGAARSCAYHARRIAATAK